MAFCSEVRKHSGITAAKAGQNAYEFVRAFPIDKEKAHREQTI